MEKKEEILQSYCDEAGTFCNLQGGNEVIDGDARPVLHAMDAYAKEIIKEFILWQRGRGIMPYVDSLLATPESHYDLFITQTQQ